MSDRISTLTAQFEPISLEEINRRASLQTRADNKYFLPWPMFTAFMESMRNTHVILEVDGQRASTYDTQYFDTAGLSSYWSHVQKRRKRFKCRSRKYVDNGQHFFEIKLKGGRGETVKHKIAYGEDEWGLVTPAAELFLQDRLREFYGMSLSEPLMPTLRTTYQRITLTGHDATERITCDFNLFCSGSDGRTGRMLHDYILIETKTERGRGKVDQALWRMGARPTSGSKYCLGLSLLWPNLRSNPFQQVRKNYFVREDHRSVDEQPVGAPAVLRERAVGEARGSDLMPLPEPAAVLFE